MPDADWCKLTESLDRRCQSLEIGGVEFCPRLQIAGDSIDREFGEHPGTGRTGIFI
jgi:hypothetical protein